jgi:hypothetical protein
MNCFKVSFLFLVLNHLKKKDFSYDNHLFKSILNEVFTKAPDSQENKDIYNSLF